MSVHVIRGHYTEGAEIVETYSDGVSFDIVDDGHLVVRGPKAEGKRFGPRIAAFAPGSWKFARIGD